MGHHLTLWIVGIDRFPSGYYRAKLDQEAAVVRSSERTQVGHTTARVTQFRTGRPCVRPGRPTA